jgi:glutathione reductase (NADPH)
MSHPTKTYDYFIIGTGPAGQTVASAAAKAGKTVGIADYRPYGGTCPLRGCDPKKVLLAAAKAMNAVERLKGKGFGARPPLDWADLQEWKRSFTEKITPGTLDKFAEQGVECLFGKARFTAPYELEVDGTRVKADHVIVATGQKPAPLDFPGADLLLTSDQFLDMDDLPESLIIVGGGYIGSEFAHIATVLGAKVTIIAAEENLVDNFDRDLNVLMGKAARERGMTIHFSSQAHKVERTEDNQVTVTAEKEDGTTFTVTADRAFHCAGRVPNIADLKLEAAGIKSGEKGIAVNNQLCTSVPAHYAIGDCNDAGLALTPVASKEAQVVVDNLLHGKNRKVDYSPIPTLAFTIPPIASVGMTAEEAGKSDKNLKINYEVTTSWFATKHQNGLVAAYKTIIDESTDTILGAHLLGAGADEMINLFALAIRKKITTSDLRRMVWGYPTVGGGIGSMVG